MKSFIASMFSSTGRYNRAKYFWANLFACSLVLLIIFLLNIIILGVGKKDFVSRPESMMVLMPVMLIGYAYIFIVSIFTAIKRFHDLDRPGTHFWLLLIPLYNIYLSFVLTFKEGTPGKNAYGPDPIASKTPKPAIVIALAGPIIFFVGLMSAIMIPRFHG